MTTEDFYNKENYSSKISKDFNYTVPIDTMRTNTRIYEYLCCLEECNQFFYDNLPQKKRLSLEEFEEELSKGITLLQILSVITPVTKIHQEEVKSYKHMDNIVLCTQILTKLIPKFFNFEPIDLYERKNIPRVIYAIHALASIYAKCFDVKIKELFGKVNFDSTEISRVEKQIKENKINLKDKREIKNELKKEQDSEKISEFLHKVVKKEERKENSKEIFEFIKLRSHQLAHRDIFKRKEPSIHTLRKVLPLFVRESVYVKKEKNLQESEITLKELKMHKITLEEEIFKLKNKILVLSHNRNKSLEKIINLNSDTKKIQEIINLYLKDHSIKEIVNLTEEEEKVILKKEEINKIINYFHTNQKYLEINEIQEEMFIPVDLNYCTNGIKHKVLVLMLISRGKNLSSLLLNCDEKDYEVQKKNFDLQQSLPEFLSDLRNEFSKFYKHLKKINKVTFPSHDIDKIFKFVIELLLEDLLFLKLSRNEREKEDLILKRKNEEISKEITELSKKKESYLSLFNEYLTYVFKKNVVDEREEGYGTFKAVINGKDFVMKCAEKDVIVLQRNDDKVTFLFSDILLRLYSGESVFYFYEEEIFLKEIVEVINLCYVY